MDPAQQDDAIIHLDGQVALITGAGGGIGQAIALARSNAGACVAVSDRAEDRLSDTARALGERQGRVLAVRADVLVRRDVERMVAQIEAALGPVDLLVNNAAIGGPAGPIAAMDPDAWWQTLEVKLRGPLYCAHAVLPRMLARRRGRIVDMASTTGFQPWPLLSSYAVSKAALFRLSESLAAETRAQGVQVFAIEPGLVQTPLTEWARSCGEPSVEEFFAQAFAQGRDIPPDGVARLVVYLASGKADVLSGRYISVSADVREMVARASDIVERDLYVLRLRA